MQLLSRPDADRSQRYPGSDRFHDVHKPHGREFRNKHLSTRHPLDTVNDEAHPLIQSDPESSHSFVGDRHRSVASLLQKQGNDAAPATHNIPVTNTAEHGLPTGVRVGLDEQLLRHQLRRAIEVDWTDRFVGTNEYDLRHAGVDGSVDHVRAPIDIRLDRFQGVVLRRRNLLEGCRVHHDVDPIHGPVETAFVAHVSNQEANLLITELLTHLELLQLIARQDPKSLEVVLLKDDFGELVPERTRPARYEDNLTVKRHDDPSVGGLPAPKFS